MTITRSAIEAKYLSAFSADKPCFIVRNVLAGYRFGAQTNEWFRHPLSGGTVSFADKPTFAADGDGVNADVATLPLAYTYDGRATLYSSPSLGGATNNYFWALHHAKWNTVSGAAYSLYPQAYYVDAAVVKAQAWGGSSDTSTYPANDADVSIVMSADTDFAGPDLANGDPVVLFDETTRLDDTTSSPNPLQSGQSHTLTELKPSAGDYRYLVNGDAYFRVEYYAKGGGYFATEPKIGEVFIGERIQLSRQPNQPYNSELAYSSIVSDFESNTGDRVRYVRAKGRRTFELTFTPTGDDTFGIDDIAQIKKLLQKTNQLTEPFMYCPKPSSEPNNCFFVYCEDVDFNMAAVGPFERSVTLTLVEIPPFVDYEVGV